jgi:hypothetical protein
MNNTIPLLSFGKRYYTGFIHPIITLINLLKKGA